MTRLTEFHKAGLEVIYLLIVDTPKKILMTIASLLLILYVIIIAMPTYLLFGYDLHKEMEDLLKVDK